MAESLLEVHNNSPDNLLCTQRQRMMAKLDGVFGIILWAPLYHRFNCFHTRDLHLIPPPSVHPSTRTLFGFVLGDHLKLELRTLNLLFRNGFIHNMKRFGYETSEQGDRPPQGQAQG